MIKFGPDFSKLKMKLNLACQRLKLLQVKKLEQIEKVKSEIASYLKGGRFFKAKIEAQKCIKDNIYVEVTELIKMYCEEILSKYELLQKRTIDSVIKGAISSLIWIGPYYQAQVPELEIITQQLSIIYGSRYYKMSLKNQEGTVDPELINRVSMIVIPNETIENYMKQICVKYGITYNPEFLTNNFYEVNHSECKLPVARIQEKEHQKLGSKKESTIKNADTNSKKKSFFGVFSFKSSKKSKQSSNKAVRNTPDKNNVVTASVSDGLSEQTYRENLPATLDRNNSMNLKKDSVVIDDNTQTNEITNDDSYSDFHSHNDDDMGKITFIPTAPPSHNYTFEKYLMFYEPPPSYYEACSSDTGSVSDFNENTNECFDPTPSCSTDSDLNSSSKNTSVEVTKKKAA